jgi:hypothetical protein
MSVWDIRLDYFIPSPQVIERIKNRKTLFFYFVFFHNRHYCLMYKLWRVSLELIGKLLESRDTGLLSSAAGLPSTRMPYTRLHISLSTGLFQLSLSQGPFYYTQQNALLYKKRALMLDWKKLPMLTLRLICLSLYATLLPYHNSHVT